MMRNANYEEAAIRLCPTCREPVRPGSPEGLCPLCLFDAGLVGSVEIKSDDSDSPATHAASPTRYFGDYELLREAGRGGMGIVYEAYQFGTQRIVALKLLSAGAIATRDAVSRF